MAVDEQKLRAALEERAAYLLDVALACWGEAMPWIDDEGDLHRFANLGSFERMIANPHAAEALTMEICNLHGASWGYLAAARGTSSQALQKSWLRSMGEEYFEKAEPASNRIAEYVIWMQRTRWKEVRARVSATIQALTRVRTRPGFWKHAKE